LYTNGNIMPIIEKYLFKNKKLVIHCTLSR
jgi:hypothetical protein